MPETAIAPLNLETLEQSAQQRLQTELPQIAPLQVRCYVRDETLVMLLEHRQPVLPYPHKAFRIFEQILDEERLAQRYRGLIYLRLQGQQQPYTFNIAPTKRDREKDLLSAARAVEDLTSDSVAETELQSDLDFAIEEAPTPSEDRVLLPPSAASKSSWFPIILMGAGMSLAIFFTSLYMLSRPCVLRECETIPVAKTLAEDSIIALDPPTSGQQILDAQKQLQKSIDLLEAIPAWSKHRGEAQGLLATYQVTAANLDDVVAALKVGSKASQLTQNRPLPVSEWQTAQSKWQEAIAHLEQIPTQNQFYSFAQRKRREYQVNLNVVNRGLQMELDGRENLAAAREAAKIAEARQGVAQTLENLQFVQSTWQTALRRLQQIPKGTTAHLEAQQDLKKYLPQYKAATQNKEQEVFATNAYNRAVRLAQTARNAEANNQWSQAVVNWRNALSDAQQVPDNTFDYGKAQSLIKTYTDARDRAEAQLQKAVKMEQARNDLQQICTQKTKVCHFTISPKTIKIHLTPTYVQEVRQTASKAQTAGDLQTQVKLLDHVYTLERALETISENLGIPLEVYTNDKVLIQSHVPGR